MPHMSDSAVPPSSAFNERFLELLRARDDTPWAPEAELHTRWFPEERADGGVALVREEESVAIGDEPVAVLKTRDLPAEMLSSASRSSLAPRASRSRESSAR